MLERSVGTFPTFNEWSSLTL